MELVGIIIILVCVIIFIDYCTFMGRRKKEFTQLPKISTSFGDISYVDLNSDKEDVLLFCTGGGVALDSVLTFGWLKNTPFRVICINRPGYNGLPVSEDFETHADIYHEVLQSLGIDKVCVFGLSMGGASALTYVKKYGARKLLLWSAITTKYLPNQEAVDSPIGKLVMGSGMKDVISYFMMRFAQLMPATTMVEFFSAGANIPKMELKKATKSLLQDSEVKAEFLSFVKTMTPMSYIYPGMMKEVEMTKDLSIDLSQIKIPCLAIHSTVDKDVPIAHLDYLEEHMPHAICMRTMCMGHYIWWGDGSHYVIDQSLAFLSK